MEHFYTWLCSLRFVYATDINITVWWQWKETPSVSKEDWLASRLRSMDSNKKMALDFNCGTLINVFSLRILGWWGTTEAYTTKQDLEELWIGPNCIFEVKTSSEHFARNEWIFRPLKLSKLWDMPRGRGRENCQLCVRFPWTYRELCSVNKSGRWWIRELSGEPSLAERGSYSLCFVLSGKFTISFRILIYRFISSVCVWRIFLRKL